MYTAEQAKEKLSAQIGYFEEYIDRNLVHFDGTALKVEINLDAYTQNTVDIGIELYKKAGWIVDTNLSYGYITFDLPRPYGTGDSK